IRRELSELDRQMLLYLAASGIPTLVALTKADKLGRGRRQQMMKGLLRELSGAVSREQVVLTSARTGEGCPELLDAVGALLASPDGSIQ
ncbi:MAG: YihA family ribosome biogenesis GTP-binding protein, partial [Gemmatimonadota bacterium]|nr:YihA family ribosome biogenesis GTP-binding protein [Gemmatimonadota bacterium]